MNIKFNIQRRLIVFKFEKMQNMNKIKQNKRKSITKIVHILKKNWTNEKKWWTAQTFLVHLNFNRLWKMTLKFINSWIHWQHFHKINIKNDFVSILTIESLLRIENIHLTKKMLSSWSVFRIRKIAINCAWSIKYNTKILSIILNFIILTNHFISYFKISLFFWQKL